MRRIINIFAADDAENIRTPEGELASIYLG